MKFTVILEPETDGGYSVICPAIPGCVSQGDSLDEALANIREAILGCLDVRVARESVDCGCFGLLYKEPVGPATVARDLVLMSLAVALVVWGQNDFELAELSGESSIRFAATLAATCATVLVTTYLAWRAT